MSRKAFWTVVSIFLAAILVTCVGFGIARRSSPRECRGIMILKTGLDYDFWKLVRRGAQTAAREYEVTLDIWAPATDQDVDGQIQLVEKAASENPDFIILAAAEKDLLAPACRDVKQRGIGLILMDSGLDAEDRIEDCFVGIRNMEAAASLANQMARTLGGKGKVAVMTHNLASTTGRDRITAIEDTLAGYPGIEIVRTVECGDDTELSYEEVNAVLDDYPDLAGVFATNERCTQSVARALMERPDKEVAFFAFDTAPSQNAALEDGTADGFVVQQAFNMGYMSVEAGSLYSRSLLRRGTIDPGWVYVTKENMRDDEIQKLIYPFQS